MFSGCAMCRCTYASVIHVSGEARNQKPNMIWRFKIHNLDLRGVNVYDLLCCYISILFLKFKTLDDHHTAVPIIPTVLSRLASTLYVIYTFSRACVVITYTAINVHILKTHHYCIFLYCQPKLSDLKEQQPWLMFHEFSLWSMISK